MINLRHITEHKLIDSAMLLGIITVFSYLLTYFYEATYLDYFGAGDESARVELVPVLKTCFLVFIAAVAVSFSLFSAVKAAKKEKHRWKKIGICYLFTLFWFVAVVFPIIYLSDPEHFIRNLLDQLKTLGVVVGIFLALSMPVAIFFAKSTKGKGDEKSSVFLERLLTHTLLPIIALTTIVFLPFMYTGFFAISAAYNANEFKLVEQDKHTLLVLREYSTHIVAVDYSEKNNQIGQNYHYLNLDSQDITYKILSKRPNYKSPLLKRIQESDQHRPRLFH